MNAMIFYVLHFTKLSFLKLVKLAMPAYFAVNVSSQKTKVKSIYPIEV